MSDFFSKEFAVGFFVNLNFLPASPMADNREGVLTRDLIAAQSGKTIFTEGDILPGQTEDFCPVNMVAHQKNLFGLVRVANLLAALSVLKEEFRFCGVLAVSHIAWFDASIKKWTTLHPKDESFSFEYYIDALKSWPRPVPQMAIPKGSVPAFEGPRLLRDFFQYIDSQQGKNG
jgi:hypothetical protein